MECEASLAVKYGPFPRNMPKSRKLWELPRNAGLRGIAIGISRGLKAERETSLMKKQRLNEKVGRFRFRQLATAKRFHHRLRNSGGHQSVAYNGPLAEATLHRRCRTSSTARSV